MAEIVLVLPDVGFRDLIVHDLKVDPMQDSCGVTSSFGDLDASNETCIGDYLERFSFGFPNK